MTSLLLSTLFLLVFYIGIKISVQFLGKYPFFVHLPWFIGAIAEGILIFFASHYVYQLLYSISYSVFSSSSQIFSGVSGLVFFITPDAFIGFFMPVLFYEWYRLSKTPKHPFLFVLLPVLAYAGIFAVLLAVSRDSEGAGWALLSFIVLLPLALTASSLWVFIQEKRKSDFATNENIQGTTNRPLNLLLIFAVLGVLLYGGINSYEYFSAKEAAAEVDRLQAESLVKLKQEIAETKRKESIPPTQNPVFDAAVAKAKTDLASYLGISESAITIATYKVDWSGITGWNFSFCDQRDFTFFPFPMSGLTVTSGEAEVIDERNLLIETVSGQKRAQASIPFVFTQPIPPYMSFDYDFTGGKSAVLYISLDSNKVGFVEYREGGLGYEKKMPLFGGDVQPSAGKHMLEFVLEEYQGDGSVKISNLHVGNHIPSDTPCIQDGSENRIVIFKTTANPTKEYRYVLNISGRYFHTDGFR